MFLWSWISVEAWSFGLNENEELRKGIISKRVNARRRGGEQVIDEEDEEHRGDDRALRYTSIDRGQIGEEAVHSDGN